MRPHRQHKQQHPGQIFFLHHQRDAQQNDRHGQRLPELVQGVAVEQEQIRRPPIGQEDMVPQQGQRRHDEGIGQEAGKEEQPIDPAQRPGRNVGQDPIDRFCPLPLFHDIKDAGSVFGIPHPPAVSVPVCADRKIAHTGQHRHRQNGQNEAGRTACGIFLFPQALPAERQGNGQPEHAQIDPHFSGPFHFLIRNSRRFAACSSPTALQHSRRYFPPSGVSSVLRIRIVRTCRSCFASQTLQSRSER